MGNAGLVFRSHGRRALGRTCIAESGEGHEGISWFDFRFHRMTPLAHAGTKTAGLMLKNFASLPASVALILRLPARIFVNQANRH